MKKLLLISILFLAGVTQLLSASQLVGFYESARSGKIYEIQETRKGLLFKSAHNNSFTLFKRVSRDRYKNKRGDAITTRYNDEIRLRQRGRTTTLYRVDRLKHNRDHYRGERNRQYQERSCFDNGQFIEGLWRRADKKGRKNQIRIDQSRRGISVHKRKGHSDYYRQVKSWDRVQIFENNYGDTFTLFRNGDLLWTSNNGRKERLYYRF